MKDKKLSNYFKALSSPQRLKLFLMVYKWFKKSKSGLNACSCVGVEKAFTKVYEQMNLSRSTISHHFKVLENAGLITCTRNGQKCICSINQEAIDAIKKFVK